MNTSDCWQAAYKLFANGETSKAMELCEKASCSASLDCQRFLGWRYYEQNNMDNALTWFCKAAQQGDGDALFGIGSVHFVQRNFPTALQYYERAADHGCPKAYSWIGYIHQLGLGVPRNIEMAANYYKKSAAHGSLLAERALIHLTFQYGNIWSKIFAAPKFVYIVLKAAVLAYRDINDERIAGIPNVFGGKAR